MLKYGKNVQKVRISSVYTVMKKEWFFDRFCGKQIAAYAEDGKLVEVAVEDEADGNILGNIYLGKVQNVVSGMQAAFISCGLERNCYLPLGESAALFRSYDGEGNASDLSVLREGDEILVQVTKLPRGNKGAKVTCDLSFVGKNLIYLPRTDFLGISRKITDPETRANLLKEADKLREPGQGFIVRTAATEATKRQLKTESEYLKRMYRSALDAAKSAPAGTAVYREYALPVKVMRDSLGGVNRIVVGDRELYEKIVLLARMRPDLGEKKIVLHEGDTDMFSEFGLSEQIYKLAETQIGLENGGYLVVDCTEAMTVIDVNTGKYTGESDLESTVFETNLLAAREIARLVRLRGIGGIVAVDFIDMAEEEHRKAIDEALAAALAEDRSKCRVYPMNELCVTLFTRKRTSNDFLGFLLKPCPHCTRQGYVLSDIFMAMRIRTAIMELFANGYYAAVIEMNRELMNKILTERYFGEEIKGIWKDKVIYIVPHSTWHEEKFTIRGDNSGVLSLPDNAQILY